MSYRKSLLALILAVFAFGCTTSRHAPVSAASQGTVCEAVSPKRQHSEWSDTWWPQRHQALVERCKQGDVDLIIIGDSITHWWDRKPQYIWDKYYGNRKALNLGFAADCTDHVLWRLQNGEVDGISPKLAVLMIGTNNTGNRHDPPEETALGIKAIVDELQKRIPATKILILGIFPRGSSPDDPNRKVNNQVNEIISKYADNQKVFYLDIGSSFLDAEGHIPRELSGGLHLSEKGYAVWAEAMEPVVKKLMGEE